MIKMKFLMMIRNKKVAIRSSLESSREVSGVVIIRNNKRIKLKRPRNQKM